MPPVPLIPDGEYIIRNGQFVAGLANGMRFTIIVASEAVDPNNKWRIQNRGNGGNQIVIESVHHPGSFVNVPGQEEAGAPLVGSRDVRLWTLVKVDQGKYMIQTKDGQYVWELPAGFPGEKFVLRRHTGRENQKWSFEV